MKGQQKHCRDTSKTTDATEVAQWTLLLYKLNFKDYIQPKRLETNKVYFACMI